MKADLAAEVASGDDLLDGYKGGTIFYGSAYAFAQTELAHEIISPGEQIESCSMCATAARVAWDIVAATPSSIEAYPNAPLIDVVT